MARYSARTEKVIIQFGETGLDKYIQKLEQMRNEARQIYREELKALEDLEKAGANAAQIKEQKVRVKELKSEYESLALAVQQSDAEFNTVRDAIFNLDNLGPRALNKLLASVKRFGKQAGSLTDETAEKLRVLEGTVKEVAEALSKGFQQGVVQLTSPIASDASYTELRNIMKQYEQYGRVIAEVADSQEEAYKTMGERATEARIRIGEMDGTLTALNDSADIKRIQEYIRGWQDIANYMGATEEQSKTAQENIRQGEGRLAAQYVYRANWGRALGLSQEEISEAVKYLEDYRKRVKMLSDDSWEELNNAINKGTQDLQKFNAETKKMTMEDQLKVVSKLSNKALADQRKYWQETLDNAVDTRGVEEAKANLQQINDLIRERSQKEVKDSGLLLYKKGQGMRINELKESIKLLKEYRDTLETTDAGGLIEVNNAIKAMNDDLKASEESLSSAKTYMQSLGNNGGIAGKSIDDLEKLKNGLEELRRTIDISGDDGKEEMKKIDKAILDVDKSIRKASMTEERFNEIIKNPQKVHSLEELQTAYDVLEKEIKKAGITQAEFVEKSHEIKNIKSQIEDLSSSMEPQRNIFVQLRDELKSLVLYHISAEAFIDKAREAFTETLDLSDQMANVQKVTNMADYEIRSLTNSLLALDTRKATDELMSLGEQAGKLGIYNTDGIQGISDFVEQSQKILMTLGEDIGGAQAVGDLKKLSDIMGVTEEFGDVGQSLDALGSSILSVGNNSAASYPATMDYLGRVGAYASGLHASAQETIALGGALDALKIPAEQGSTALIQIMRGIENYTASVARAAKLDPSLLADTLKDEGIYHALNLVLQSIADGQVSIQGVMNVLGARAKSNASIARVLSSLSQNLDMLDQQLLYARDGFDSARDGLSLMTQEFERSNSSAAGYWARINNELKEMYISAGQSEMLKSVLVLLHDIVKAFGAVGFSGTALRTTFTLLVGAVTAFRTGMVKAFMRTNFYRAITKFNVAMKEFYVSVRTSQKGILQFPAAFRSAAQASNLFAVSIKAIGTAFKAVAWFLVIDALATITMHLINVKRRHNEVIEAINTQNEATLEEKNKIDDVVLALKDENLEKEERNKLINEFNARAGKYLGFLLDETATAEDLAVAYAKVNAELENKSRIERISGARSVIDSQYSKELNEIAAGIIKSVQSTIGGKGGGKAAGEVVAFLETNYKKYDRTSDNKELVLGISKILEDNGFKSTVRWSATDAVRAYLYNQQSMFSKYMLILQKKDKDLEDAIIYATGLEEADADDLRKKALDAARVNKKQLDKRFAGGSVETMTTEQVSQLLQEVTAYIAGMEGSNAKLTAEEKQSVKLYKERRKALQNRMTELERKKYSAWGKEGDTYKEMSSETLSAMYKMFDESETFVKEGIDYQRVFPQIKFPEGQMTTEELREFFRDEAKTIKDILDSRGNTTKANFKWSDDGSGSEKKLKEEYEAAIASLDAYYKERETLIQIAQNNEEITEEEANRRRQSLEMEHLAKRAQLRRNAISQMGSDERQTFEGWWAGIEELDAVNWNKLRSQSEKWGKGYRQKQVLATKKDLSEIAKIVNDHKEKIDKILADANPTKKLVMEFGAAMDSLDMIFGANEQVRNKNIAAQRLTQYIEWGRDAYELSVKDLEKAMENESNIFHSWYQQLGEDRELELAVLLMQLRKFNDDLTEVGIKASKEAERIAKYKWEREEVEGGGTRKENAEAKISFAAKKVGASEILKGEGLVTDQAELELANAQYEKEKEYLDLLREQLQAKKELLETEIRILETSIQKEEDQWNKVVENSNEEYSQEEVVQAQENLDNLYQKRQQLTELRLELGQLEINMNQQIAESEAQLADIEAARLGIMMQKYERTIERIHEFQEPLESFAQSMTEGIYGSKEDRQTAFKDFLSDMAKLAKKRLQTYLTNLALQKIFGDMELRNQQTINKQKEVLQDDSLASTGATYIAELGVKAATTEAGVIADSAKAQAKEYGEKGILGSVTAGIISLALSALLGLALGRISKAKSEVAAATGASSGKLATGMLTYGKGKYPTVYAEGKYADGTRYWVTGNDGQDYNAKYTDNLQTGIYHGPHMAIFSEEGDEMVIDHKTLAKMPRRAIADILMLKRTGRMSLDYNAITDAANTLSLTRSRSLANTSHRKGIRMYADGNIEDVAESLLSGGNVNQIVQTQADVQTQAALINVINRLTDTLDAGLGVNMYGSRGLKKAQEKDERWSRRNRLR